MTIVRDRNPTAAELAYVDQVQQWSKRFRSLNSDAALRDAYGPDAAEELWMCLSDRLNNAHWAVVLLRRGDFILLVTDGWPLAKSSGELPLYVLGRLVRRNGNTLLRRVQPNIDELGAAVVDFDTGDAPLDLLADRATTLGVYGVAYPSPSNGACTMEILRHPGAPRAGVEDVVAPTPEACLTHLIAKGYRSDILGPLTVIDPARVVHTKHRFKNRKTGQWETRESVNTRIVLRHNPLAKSRFVGFLKTPFRRGPDESVREFNTRWSETVLGPLIRALGFYADPSCSDVNRCFYFPSALMPSGATHG